MRGSARPGHRSSSAPERPRTAGRPRSPGAMARAGAAWRSVAGPRSRARSSVARRPVACWSHRRTPPDARGRRVDGGPPARPPCGRRAPPTAAAGRTTPSPGAVGAGFSGSWRAVSRESASTCSGSTLRRARRGPAAVPVRRRRAGRATERASRPPSSLVPWRRSPPRHGLEAAARPSSTRRRRRTVARPTSRASAIRPSGQPGPPAPSASGRIPRVPGPAGVRPAARERPPRLPAPLGRQRHAALPHFRILSRRPADGSADASDHG